ncbi:Lipoprotein [Pseudomonas sp. IT-196MI5]|uniref:hypothetical protein n=1 Tax=Pseudomonas sp. IT-196MI5 TaxID=3026440 RepID=UPI0039DFA82D
MKAKTIATAAALLVLCNISGCATVDTSNSLVNSDVQLIPLSMPMPVKTIEIYNEKTKKRVDADVLSLKSSDIRARLTGYDTFVTIEQFNSSGSLTYLGSGGKVSRGKYRVTFDYTNYTNQKVSFNDSDKPAIGRIGVGLRITADLTTSANEVDLSGLLPLGFAAEDKKVTGSLRFLVYGMSNDKIPLAAPTQQILDVSAIQKSFEAAATVRVLFGLEETRLEPWLIGVSGVKPAEADQAIKAATNKLIK